MIIQNKSKELKKFKDLEIGDVFQYKSEIYIKCQILLNDPIEYNVFQLNDSSNYHFQDDTLVEIIEYDFIIKN